MWHLRPLNSASNMAFELYIFVPLLPPTYPTFQPSRTSYYFLRIPWSLTSTCLHSCFSLCWHTILMWSNKTPQSLECSSEVFHFSASHWLHLFCSCNNCTSLLQSITSHCDCCWHVYLPSFPKLWLGFLGVQGLIWLLVRSRCLLEVCWMHE